MSGTPPERQGHHERYGGWDPHGAETAVPEAYAPEGYTDGPAEFAYGVPQQHVPRQYDPEYAPQPYDHGVPQAVGIPAQYTGDAFAPAGHPHDGGVPAPYETDFGDGVAADDPRDTYGSYGAHIVDDPESAHVTGDFDHHDDAPFGQAAFAAGHTARLTPVLPHVVASEVDFAPARTVPAASEPVSLRDRVPIWHPPGIVPAFLTAGFAVVLAGGALAGGAASVGSVVLLQVFTAAGWFRLHGMWPARQGILLAVVAAFVADAAVLVADDHALRVLPGVMAGVVGVVLLQQLARRDGRPELMPALTVTLSAATLAVLDVLFVLAARVDGPGVRDGAVVAAGVAAVAAAVVCAALPLPGPVGAVLGLAAAAGAGAVVGSATDLGSAAVLGAGAGLLGLLGRRLAGYDHPSRFVHMTAGVALPLALAAPAVYLLGRMAIG
ncbi:hypothetical protein LO772_15865 [Yinghuangia sp. ASG 101]|uniref:hypothetical protein n=1 Tax=Yinghuangia sp. ASG 101 TaxID=2896848 RepID=UPI001E3CDDE5|nr:hypothetical protein [Yinghuangia sp. ASG 101]UGQ14914.1 hypothetical protein LO772_15865 [Yinghuangia sp. ASG 101]